MNLRFQQRDLWLVRFYYFVGLGGSGFIAPFLNLFYIRLGLSGTDIGLVAAGGAIITLIAAPLWTSQTRRWRNPRVLLQLSLVLTAAGYGWLGAQTAFLGIALVVAARALFGAGLSPLSDTLALSVTGAHKLGFGSVRVWASMGWIVAVLSSGWLIEHVGFVAAFAGVCVATALGALFLFPLAPMHFEREWTTAPAIGLVPLIRSLLRNRVMLGIAVMLIVIGMGNSGVAQFETVYLNQLGAKESVLGVAGMVSAVVEIPFMLWADRLVRQAGSHRLLLVAMLGNVALRAMVLLVPSIFTIIAQRAMGGVSFSFYVVALTSFIGEQTTPQETGTVLALYSLTLASLISIVSAPLAGAAFDAFGARWMYLIASVGYLLGWFCLRLTRPNTRVAERA